MTGAGATPRRERIDASAVLLLLACCFLWGLNQVAVKLALPEVSGLQQAALRSIGAAFLVWAWAAWCGRSLWARDGSLPGGLLAGTLFAVEFACIFVGLEHTTASRMVVFLYLSPFVVALGMPFIARNEALAPLQIIGLVGAFAGVAAAFAEGWARPPPAGTSAIPWLGDTLGVLAGVLWGATTLAIRGSRLGQASAEKILFYQLGIAGLLLGGAAMLAAPPWPLRLSALAWGSLLFQTVVVSFVSYLVWFWLVRHYPATRLASFTLLTPVFGLAMGAGWLGEAITLQLLLALAAVAAGIVLVNRR